MAGTIAGRTKIGTTASGARNASTRWKSARWPVAAACAAGATAWLSADLLELSREAFVVPHVLVGCVLTALFVHAERIDLLAAARRNPMRSVLVTAISSVMVLGSVLAQPGAARADGPRLAFELAWDGVAYGAVDGVLLTVVPISAVRRALGGVRWTRDLLALFASIAVFVVYHLGFPEFRGTAIVAPIVAGVIFGVAYLVSKNPLTPVVAHVAMHIAAVLHGPAGTMQLPPHY